MNIIETQNLTKSYADFTAVSNVNLHIPKGAVYGFLGPNGAGKSTTMKMFLGLTKPTSGSFTIDGKKYPEARVEILKEVGSFIEAPAFYGNLSGEENLEIIRKILGLPKSSVSEALEVVGLTQFKKRLAKKYSLGMKQRLGLASALIGQPPILILDEPTNGLDPVGIHEIRTLIRSLPEKYNCTVFVSSHLLSEVELMADTVGILNHGRLLFEGTLDQLRSGAAAQGYPTDNLEDTFLALIDADNSTQGSISKNEYPKFLPNSNQKSLPISNQCDTQNAIEAASMASTTTLIIEVKTSLSKKMVLSLIGSDFIFCIALSANSV